MVTLALLILQALHAPEPDVSAEQARLVSMAREMLRHDGATSTLKLRNIVPEKVRSQDVDAIQFVDDDAYDYFVCLRKRDHRRVLSENQNLAALASGLLHRLGVPGFFRQRGAGPFPNGDPPSVECATTLFDQRGEKYSLYFTYPGMVLVAVEKAPIETFINPEAHKPTDADLQAARNAVRALSAGAGELDPSASEFKGTLQFNYHIPPAGKPWMRHVRASFRLDMKDHHIVYFQGPWPTQVQYAETVTEIDPEYTTAFEGLQGKVVGETRGRRFAKVQVTLGDAAWGKPVPRDAFGWLSRDSKKVTCMDGVELPVDRVVRLQTVENALLFPPATGRWGAIDLLSPTNVTPGLLLQAGEDDLAKKLFHVMKSEMYPFTYGLFETLHTRYRMLTADALKRGLDSDAKAWATDLVEVDRKRRPLRGQFARNDYRDVAGELVEAEALSAYLTERVSRPRSQAVDFAMMEKLPQQDRIGRLIDALDTVGVMQMGQPGGVNFLDDPIVKHLAAEGAAIVPMLLDVIEKDNRYTRTISFGRDFFPQRSFHSVRSVAYRLLEKVWPSAPSVDRANNARAAKRLRADWRSVAALTEGGADAARASRG